MRRRAWFDRFASPLVPLAVALASVPWLVQPGFIQPDTKVDLVVDPGRYLSRALEAWSTHSGFGELQNQAYGYLFPMGSVYWLGYHIGIPEWATQRVWWSLMLCAAGIGTYLFARQTLRLGPPAAALAGVAYALSPRVLTLLTQLSVEAWPGCLLPWLLWIIWRRTRGTEPTTAVRFSAEVGVLAVCLGGVNATASLVPLFAGALAVLMTDRSWRTLVAFAAGCLLGALWWLGPLVVLGGYAYPFMDYIETSSITTAVTSLTGVLRGASDWVAYIIDSESHPVWQSGWVVAQSTASIVGGCIFAAIGLYGLTVREAPSPSARAVTSATGVDAWFNRLIILLLVGTLVMTAGYHGLVSGPFSDSVRDVLDGALAPLRNVHKFDPLVRLPLVLGCAVFVQRLLSVRRESVTVGGASHSPLNPMPPALNRQTLTAIASVLAVFLLTLAPMWQGRVTSSGAMTHFPPSVEQTASYLDARAHQSGGSTLVLPSARTATYIWGTSTDEPLSAFAASEVIVRASAPLFHPGAQRFVDAVDQAISSNDPARTQSALTALSRVGVHRIVVTSGLATSTQTAPPEQYRRALERFSKQVPTPGAASVRSHTTFGQGVTRYDVYEFTTPEIAAQTGPMVGVPVLGGPESVLSLLQLGLRPDAVLLTGKADGWLTDDVRRRVYANGKPPALAFGPTLFSFDPNPYDVGKRDLVFPGDVVSQTTITVDGGVTVRASGSLSDPYRDGYLGPGAGPASALDDSPQTAWWTSTREPGTLTLEWPKGSPGQLILRPRLTGDAASSNLVVTRDGNPVRAHHVAASPQEGQRQAFDVPAGTKRLGISFAPRSSASKSSAIGVSDLGLAWASSSFPGTLPRAVTLLPGALAPERNGVLLTRREPIADHGQLKSEDDGVWTRRVRVSDSGNLTLKLTSSAPRVAVRFRSSPAQPWRTLVVTDASATLPVAAPYVELQLDAETQQVVLLPRSLGSRQHLGLASRPAEAYTLDPGDQGAAPNLWVTNQGASAGWRPSHGTPVVVDGWRQAAQQTAGQSTSLSWSFTPQRSHQAALCAGGAGVVVIAALLVSTWGRRGYANRGPRGAAGAPNGLPDVVPLVTLWLTLVVSTGVWGVVAGVVGLTLHKALNATHRARVGAALIAGACVPLLFGGVVASGAWGVAVSQVVVAFGLGLLFSRSVKVRFGRSRASGAVGKS